MRFLICDDPFLPLDQMSFFLEMLVHTWYDCLAVLIFCTCGGLLDVVGSLFLRLSALLLRLSGRPHRPSLLAQTERYVNYEFLLL